MPTVECLLTVLLIAVCILGCHDEDDIANTTPLRIDVHSVTGLWQVSVFCLMVARHFLSR